MAALHLRCHRTRPERQQRDRRRSWQGLVCRKVLPQLSANDYNYCGDTIAHVSLLVMTFKDGTIIEVPSDLSWTVEPARSWTLQVYDIEAHHSRLEPEIKGWSRASFDDSKWYAAKELPPLVGKPAPSDSPVRKVEELMTPPSRSMAHRGPAVPTVWGHGQPIGQTPTTRSPRSIDAACGFAPPEWQSHIGTIVVARISGMRSSYQAHAHLTLS
ncbi:hypothetical protein B0T10DRAFT_458346 [Thelonectria olida]|uniref:Bacterial alpha-L-rhamnosidase N-terminal domain-containing protein n=1 Tax=Thelonectria olida TaxID=1576542 RepID=A0A9P8W735_9HYPO|nr:hypothetical protein B0T10DRAFT_458346 [Thelonectria olida]